MILTGPGSNLPSRTGLLSYPWPYAAFAGLHLAVIACLAGCTSLSLDKDARDARDARGCFWRLIDEAGQQQRLAISA